MPTKKSYYEIKNSPKLDLASTFCSILAESLVIWLAIVGVYLNHVIDHRNKTNMHFIKVLSKVEILWISKDSKR